MEPQNLQRASFRGVTFLVTGTSLAGGRRAVRKLFPNSDRQVVEDLGLTPREFSLTGSVAAALGLTYEENRDALLKALDEKGAGILVHPFLGRVERAVVLSYTLDEATSQLGDASLQVTFTVDDGSPSPQAAESVVGSVSQAATASADAAETGVSGLFKVTTSAVGNFTAGVAKVTEVSNRVTDAVRFAITPGADVTSLLESANALQKDARELVLAPSTLADRVTLLLLSIPEVHLADAKVTLDIFLRLFDFGDDDVPILPLTPALAERKRNAESLNAAVQVNALAQAYLAAARLDFSTVDEVDQTADLLEDQYQKMVTARTATPDSLRELAQARVVAKRFFDQQKILRPRIIDVVTPLTSARLLSFQYYGTSERGEEIALLNGLDDSAFVEGVVRILSA